MKKFFIIFLISTFFYSSIYALENNNTFENNNTLSKEEKLLYMNMTTTVLLLAYGVEHWGYDLLHTKPYAQSEGWFEKNTKHGGADKFGHAYVGYLSSHIFSYAYEDWGYTHSQSSLYGMYSSLLFTTIMEVGDSFGYFGLSYEDMVSNILGALLGYYTYQYSELKEVLDYRLEYKIRKGSFNDKSFTDYENSKYIFAIKGSGFNNKYIKYLELYLGYNIEGYEKQPYMKDRNVFVGFGINLSEVFNTKIFNYYQIPGSYISNDF